MLYTVDVVDGVDPIWLDGIGCLGDEDALVNCTHSPFGSSDCGHSEDVGIECGMHVWNYASRND